MTLPAVYEFQCNQFQPCNGCSTAMTQCSIPKVVKFGTLKLIFLFKSILLLALTLRLAIYTSDGTLFIRHSTDLKSKLQHILLNTWDVQTIRILQQSLFKDC